MRPKEYNPICVVLKQLTEDGTRNFGVVVKNCFNIAMQLERERDLGVSSKKVATVLRCSKAYKTIQFVSSSHYCSLVMNPLHQNTFLLLTSADQRAKPAVVSAPYISEPDRHRH